MAVAINHSDPGAVPGASTQALEQADTCLECFGGGELGSTRA